MILKQNWSDVSDEPISEEGVHAMHVPKELYKFEAETHGSGQSFTVKGSNDFILYVVHGICKTTVDGNLLQLAAGEFVFLGKGAYQFKSTGTEDVRVVYVAARA